MTVCGIWNVIDRRDRFVHFGIVSSAETIAQEAPGYGAAKEPEWIRNSLKAAQRSLINVISALAQYCRLYFQAMLPCHLFRGFAHRQIRWSEYQRFTKRYVMA